MVRKTDLEEHAQTKRQEGRCPLHGELGPSAPREVAANRRGQRPLALMGRAPRSIRVRGASRRNQASRIALLAIGVEGLT